MLGWAALGCVGPDEQYFFSILSETILDISCMVSSLFYFHQCDNFNREIVSSKVCESKHSLFFSAANLIKFHPLIILEPTRHYN
jgi:hypothetical protein